MTAMYSVKEVPVRLRCHEIVVSLIKILFAISFVHSVTKFTTK